MFKHGYTVDVLLCCGIQIFAVVLILHLMHTTYYGNQNHCKYFTFLFQHVYNLKSLIVVGDKCIHFRLETIVLLLRANLILALLWL